MNYLTTTELRTKTSKLIKELRSGGRISLIHRSKVVAKIEPVEPLKTFDAKRFKKLIEALNLPKTSAAQRDSIYRKPLLKKYGKDLS